MLPRVILAGGAHLTSGCLIPTEPAVTSRPLLLVKCIERRTCAQRAQGLQRGVTSSSGSGSSSSSKAACAALNHGASSGGEIRLKPPAARLPPPRSLGNPRLETCVGSREAAVAEDSTRIATDPASTNEPIHRRAAPPALGFPKEALSEIHQTTITVDPGCAATVSRQPSASGDRRVFRDMFCQWLHKYGISTQPCNRDSRVLRGRAGSRRWGGGTASYRLGGSQHPFYRGRLTWRAWQGGAAGCILLGCILLQSPMVWNGVGRPVAICQPLCMRMMVQGKQRIRRPRSLKIVERMVLKPKQIGCCPSGGQSLRQSAQCARKDPGWKGWKVPSRAKPLQGAPKWVL